MTSILNNESTSCTCGSITFVKNREGFTVCNGCGQLQNEVNFDSFVSSNLFNTFGLIQGSAPNPIPNTTKIGTIMEKKATQMKKVWLLERMNNIKNYGYDLYIPKITLLSLSKIVSALGLEKGITTRVFEIYKKIHLKIPKGNHINGPERMAPVLLYIVSRIDNLGISLDEIVEHSVLTKHQIFKFSQQLQGFFTTTRSNHRNRILAKINKICIQNDFEDSIEREAISLINKAPTYSNAYVIAVSLIYIALKNQENDIKLYHITAKTNTPLNNSSVYKYVKRFFKYPDSKRFRDLVQEIWKEDSLFESLNKKYILQRKMWRGK